MFMKYNRVRLDAHLLNGKHAVTNIVFKDGCNLILTDSNTQGKSSVINALAVGLGFDDLVKSNVSALVNDSIKVNGQDEAITSADIFLEIQNEKGEFLSIKREVKPDVSKGVLVKRAQLSEWNHDELEEYYLGSGSYTDTKGFHRLLSEFIGFPEIQVISQDDGAMRLYLEYIFSAIFIEQKRGWADIMSNAPYYRVRDPKKSTVSEILGMDYIKNNLQRNALKLETDRLKASYESNLETLRQYINGRHFSLKGMPDLSSEVWNPRVYRSYEGQEDVSLDALIVGKKDELSGKQEPLDSVSENPELEKKVFEVSENITALISNKNELDNTISSLDGSIRRYEQRMIVLESDLEKNKEEQKIRKLFSRDPWSTKAQCPVCEQPIDESLLSQVRSFPTMSIDDNVKYINEQKSLLQDVLSVEKERQYNANIESQRISSEIKDLMRQISEFQRSLSGMIPSELMAYAREVARLEQEIDDLGELSIYSQNMFEKMKEIFDRYQLRNKTLNGLKSDLSDSDKGLLRKFQAAFRKYLEKLGYNSYEIGAIFIDEATFLPRVTVNSLDQKKRMRADFGSSASDWIRIITAYTLALHISRGNSSKSNHPNISVFDEPAQQNMDKADHLELYPLVAEVCDAGGQVIIAATDKDHTVRLKAEALGMNIIDFGSNYVLAEEADVASE